MNVPGAGIPLAYSEKGHRHGGARPPRARAARIQDERPRDATPEGPVCMTVHDDPCLRKARRESGVIGILVPVDHRDRRTGKIDPLDFLRHAPYGEVVHVAPYSRHGRQCGQLFEDPRLADVPGMQDVGHSAEGLEHLRA